MAASMYHWLKIINSKFIFSNIYYICKVKYKEMKKNLFFALATAMLLLPFMNCEAQASLEFKKLDVNNINRWTNHRFSNDCCRIGDKVSSGVSISVTAELTNTSDDVLYFDEQAGDGIRNVNLAVNFYDLESEWVKMYLYNSYSLNSSIDLDIDSLAPGESMSFQASVGFPASLFQNEPPLYYMSSIAATMYLSCEISGHEPFFSDMPENIFLNGEKLKIEGGDCYYCGEMYVVTHNADVMAELMEITGRSDLSSTFGNILYSNYFMGKAFVCNMGFTRRLLPIPKYAVK